MPKVNVYLPEDLADAVKHAGVPVSAVCQHALSDAVAAASGRSPLNPSRLTDRARDAINMAARSAADSAPTTVDLLDGILADQSNLAVVVLNELDIAASDLQAEVRAAARRRDGSLDPLQSAVARAVESAADLEHDYVGCEHLLIGLATGGDAVAWALGQLGADARTTRLAVRAALAGYAYARETLTFSGLSAPVRAALDEIRQRLIRLEGPAGSLSQPTT